MKCASALSTSPDSPTAFDEVIGRVTESLGTGPADLAVVFSSAHHISSLDTLVASVKSRGLARHFLGCTGETIVGEGREIENGPALSLWAIHLPEGVHSRPVRLEWQETGFVGLPDDLASFGSSASPLILLGDPFSFPPDRLFLDLEAAAPGLRIVGGLASASQQRGGNRLILDDRVYSDGAVGMLFDGPIALRTVVSQGCRPVGRPMIVTKSEGNVIKELGRRPALEVLRETFLTLDDGDKALIREGLHMGRVINEYQERFGRGDFLVRNVIGSDDDGGIAITELVRVGQTVQFHVRDAHSAEEDLQSLLNADQAGTAQPSPAGGLLFSCNGRGTRLFSAPDHDALAIRERFGPIPVAGFFAMGEFGPIGGKNFVHGYTASLALFADEG